MEKKSGAESPSITSPVDNHIVRDTIISANVIVGQGASSVIVAENDHVVDVHEKITTSGSCLKYPVINGRRTPNSS